MPAIDWSVLQSALRNWVASSAGIEAVWAGQKREQTRYPYAVLQIIAGPTAIAPGERRYTSTGVSLTEQALSLSEITVNIQIYSDTQAPANHALSHLSQVVASLDLTHYRDLLRAAGLSLVAKGSISTLADFAGTQFMSRATIDVRFYALSKITPPQGSDFFDSVSVANMITPASTDVIDPTP
jgi:hypothetical protein